MLQNCQCFNGKSTALISCVSISCNCRLQQLTRYWERKYILWLAQHLLYWLYSKADKGASFKKKTRKEMKMFHYSLHRFGVFLNIFRYDLLHSSESLRPVSCNLALKSLTHWSCLLLWLLLSHLFQLLPLKEMATFHMIFLPALNSMPCRFTPSSWILIPSLI